MRPPMGHSTDHGLALLLRSSCGVYYRFSLPGEVWESEVAQELITARLILRSLGQAVRNGAGSRRAIVP